MKKDDDRVKSNEWENVALPGGWGKSGADAGGKVRGVRCGLCGWIDEGTCFQFREGESARFDGAPLKHHFVGLSIDEHAPIPRGALVGGVLGADARRAIGGDG